ncbi:MAG: formimidoylglutamate deiminase [Phycisphaerae bacterium]|nr:formimidoylglutamate deiminase [Phycisphaerae bacterium]
MTPFGGRVEQRTEQLVHPDWTWINGRLERGVALGIDGGRITYLGPPNRPSTLRLPGKALVPGFVSAHSHAFQRGLRGLVEGRPDAGAAGEAKPGGFFSWRDAMYALVDRLTEESCYELSKQCFSEMLASGFTTVGEFHYVRHLLDANGQGDESKRYALDGAVLAAARDAGIRIVLLDACYMTGGFGKPLAGGQRRFETRDEREYWSRFDALAAACDPATQSVGVTAHSVRAVPIDILERLHAESVRRNAVFHMHLEEVRQEIADCMAAHGRRPCQLLLERLAIDGRFTVVHATHTTAEDLGGLAERGATVCLCPLTEANLGDGVCDVGSFRAKGGHLAIGTDLNSRLSATEELRWLEYVQRLRHEKRVVAVGSTADAGAELLAIGTANGARSLGLDAGAFQVGALADAAIVDLNHSTMAGWTPETFASHLVFGTGTSAVCGTCVGGRWKIRRA